MFKMDEIQGWDLDHPWQLEMARTLVKHKYKIILNGNQKYKNINFLYYQML